MPDKQTPQRRSYEASFVASISEELAQLPEKTPDDMSAKQAISEIADDIEAAMQRGYSLEDIHAYLTGKGFDLGLTTLRTYYAQSKLKTTRNTKARRKPLAAKAAVQTQTEPKPKAKTNGARNTRSAKVETPAATAAKPQTPSGFVEPTEDY